MRINLKFWRKEAQSHTFQIPKFEIGDMVKIRAGEISPSSFECYRHCEFEIIQVSYKAEYDWLIMAHDGATIDADAMCLKKIPPGEEGVSSWSKCVWKPSRMTVREFKDY